MTKSHMSVWVLPQSRKTNAKGITRREARSGAFIVASCGDEDFAVVPEAASNHNRRIWPTTTPTRPQVRAR